LSMLSTHIHTTHTHTHPYIHPHTPTYTHADNDICRNAFNIRVVRRAFEHAFYTLSVAARPLPAAAGPDDVVGDTLLSRIIKVCVYIYTCIYCVVCVCVYIYTVWCVCVYMYVYTVWCVCVCVCVCVSVVCAAAGPGDVVGDTLLSRIIKVCVCIYIHVYTVWCVCVCVCTVWCVCVCVCGVCCCGARRCRGRYPALTDYQGVCGCV